MECAYVTDYTSYFHKLNITGCHKCRNGQICSPDFILKDCSLAVNSLNHSIEIFFTAKLELTITSREFETNYCLWRNRNQIIEGVKKPCGPQAAVATLETQKQLKIHESWYLVLHGESWNAPKSMWKRIFSRESIFIMPQNEMPQKRRI